MDLSTLTLDLEMHVDIAREADAVFAGMLREFSENMRYDDGRSMDMKLEAWPGGRWYRDLGDQQGHLWGFVQTIKSPVLLELTGQMFMSYPVCNHVSCRVTEIEGGARLTLRHRAFGLLDPEHCQGVATGWKAMLDAVKRDAEQ